MNKQRLTPAQQELLDAMKRGVSVYCERGLIGDSPYFWRSDNDKKCTITAKSLMRRKLIRVSSKFNHGAVVIDLT